MTTQAHAGTAGESDGDPDGDMAGDLDGERAEDETTVTTTATPTPTRIVSKTDSRVCTNKQPPPTITTDSGGNPKSGAGTGYTHLFEANPPILGADYISPIKFPNGYEDCHRSGANIYSDLYPIDDYQYSYDSVTDNYD